MPGKSRWTLATGLCVTAIGPAIEASGQVSLFTDPVAFDSALKGANKVTKGSWNFEPHTLEDGVIVDLIDVLDIFNHVASPNDPWTDPVGTNLWPAELDNVTFSANINPAGPYEPHGPDLPQALAFVTTGYNAIVSNCLAADFFIDSFTILSGPPAGDNHTAMSLTLLQVPGFAFPAPVFEVTVYDKQDAELGSITIPANVNEEVYLGIIVNVGETIGRVDVWDQSGSLEGITSIAVYATGQPPTCPWDCGPPYNKTIEVLDLLQLLADWDPGSPVGCSGGACDFNGDGCVDVTDLLEMLGMWNEACPAPPNDQCADFLAIDRLDSAGLIIETFDLYGATADPEPYECLTTEPMHKDIWYCLTNSTAEDKTVDLGCTIDLLIEVYSGCTCPTGASVSCGPGLDGAPPFPRAAGESVMIRLVNYLDLPNGDLQGSLIIDNQVILESGVNFFTDPALFLNALNTAGKVEKLSWDFKPHFLPDGVFRVLDDPLNIVTHANDPNDPWTDGKGADLWPPEVRNIQFSANKTPQGPLDPRGGSALVFAAQGFLNLSNDALVVNNSLDSLDITSGLPFPGIHTAMSLELFRPDDAGMSTYKVTVYDKADAALGDIDVVVPAGDKVFIGFVTKGADTIGRVEVWDIIGDNEAIASIAVYLVDQPPTCPWDCGPPYNKTIDVLDLLQLLADWDPGSPVGCSGGVCDFNGDGCVDVTDLLEMLGMWNEACPAPPNDQCADFLAIDRLDAVGQITELFDLYGATADPEPYDCLATPPVHKDVWYCLTNSAAENKKVDLSCTIDLFIEVYSGCTCPTGALVACGPGLDGVGPFLLAAGESVMIRLVNHLDLPNGDLQGTLIIDNVESGVNFFADPALFLDEVNTAGKIEKLSWDFKPHLLPDGGLAVLDDPLHILTHENDPDDPWTDGIDTDLWPPEVDNIQFSANKDPQGPLDPRGTDALTFVAQELIGSNNSLVVNDTLDSLDITSGLPVAGNHTAMSLELFRPQKAGVSTYKVTVYDKADVAIGDIDVAVPAGDTVFIGFVTKGADTIGRVEVWDVDGGNEAISSIDAYEAP